MSLFKRIFQRWRLYDDLAEELRQHLEEKTQQLMRVEDLPRSEAEQAARRAFGNLCLLEERSREVWQWPKLESVSADAKYALRQLRRSPGFAVVAILTFALGIGANTALFSVANGLFLRPLPVGHPEQLVVLAAREKGLSGVRDISYPDYLDYRSDMKAFSDIAGYDIGLDGLAAEHWAERAVTCYVTGNYFSMLQLKPALGRLIQPGEGATPGADPVIVLSYSFWKRQFLGDPHLVGKEVLVNGRPETVIGVAPKEFHGTKAWVETDAYLPISQMREEGPSFWTSRSSRGEGGFTALARLRPAVGVAQARASLNTTAQQLARQYPQADRNISVEVYPEPFARPQADGAEEAPPMVAAFIFLALIVLIVACVNLASMLETRAVTREGEMAVRAALGAGRTRLAQQCMTEGILLALVGGGAGIVLAELLSKLLSSMCTPVDVSLFKLNFQPNWRVFAYSFGVALVAGIVTGLAPAKRAWRSSPNSTMREAAPALSIGRRHHRFLSTLVIAQIAASTVLLVAAGLFIRSLGAVEHADLGFDGHHVLNFGMDLAELGYNEAQGQRLYQQLLARVSTLPGAASASYLYSTPFYHNRLGSLVWIEGNSVLVDQRPPPVFYNIASSSMFNTLRIPIIRGRNFGANDLGESPKVAIVSQAMAQRFWPGRDPIGERFSTSGPTGPWIDVVGIADNSQFVGPTIPKTQPYFFLPLTQNYKSALALQVRTQLPPATAIREIEQQIHELAPTLALFDVRSQEEALNGATGFFLFRLGAEVATGLGVLGLLLTVLGVYGVVSYAARLRTHEIGIRMALGAQRKDVLKLVIGRGSRSVFIGVTIGAASALALAQLMSNLLYAVKSYDPLTFVLIPLILVTTTLLACYIPARRAANFDPAQTLRAE